MDIYALLNSVKSNDISIEQAAKILNADSYEDIGIAKLDYQRVKRRGFTETVFCLNKTPKQCGEIALSFDKNGSENVLFTRVNDKIHEEIKLFVPNCTYYPLAKIVVLKPVSVKTNGKIAVVTAGTSDLVVAEEAAVTAEIMGNDVLRIYDVGVAGIHRLLSKIELINSADVIITIAGMEGALAGVIAGLTNKPVIAVPTSCGYGSAFEGLSALLTMLNSCAEGIGVVNIDNGYGAACLAAMITRQKNV